MRWKTSWPDRPGRASELRARYEAFLEEHQRDYRKFYDRVDVDLGEDLSAGLPTSRRLAYGAEGVDDPSLYGLYLQYSRYLIIAGSQAGQPGAESTGDLERYRDATLVQQLHEQHQRGDELLAGGDRKPLRVSSASDGPFKRAFRDRKTDRRRILSYEGLGDASQYGPLAFQ